MERCSVNGCNSRATTITNRTGRVVCQDCRDEMDGEYRSLGEALGLPSLDLRKKLKALLDTGRLRK